GDVDAAVAVLVGDEPGHGLALLPRLAVHGVEAAAQAGDGLADQFAGTLDLAARALDFLADETAQFAKQLFLLADHAGMFPRRRRRSRAAQQQPGGEAEPAERLG